jgi:uncharacterized metal-binding protein YceD (DUF177 family)
MPQTTPQSIHPEFSRPLSVDQHASPQHSFTVEATEAERKALAKRFKLVSLESLRAQGTLESFDDGRRARLTAHFTAEVTQSCVVTLDPVPAKIEETFTLDYDADADPAALSEPEIPDDLELFLEQPDPPDPLVGGVVDVGEAVAEHVALALDPYPRAPGVAFEPPGGSEAVEDSPFKALAGLVKKGRS